MTRPLCSCGNLAERNGKYYLKECNSCRLKRYGTYEKKRVLNYPDIDKNVCERCGFEPEDRCQMDVHHIDLNHENESDDNLQILCSNCHRLIHRAPLSSFRGTQCMKRTMHNS